MLTNKNKYDVVIVGGGLSGLISAFQAADKGLKTLVLEKGRNLGGSGNYVEGLCAVGTEMQKAKGINYTPSQLVQTELNYSHYEADSRSLKEYFNESAETLKWLQSKMGVEFTEVTKLGSGMVTWHLLKGQGKEQIQKNIIPSVKKVGCEIEVSVSAQKILKDGKGKVSGLVIKSEANGAEEAISTNAVVIATGGFLNNPKLLREETGYNPDKIININSGKNTGDGQKLAWAAGAQRVAKGTLMAFNGYLNDPTNPPYKYWYSEMNTAASLQSLLFVNEQGDRFVNEQVTDNFADCGNVFLHQNAVYSIIDQATVDYLSKKGLLKIIEIYYEDINKPLSHLQEQIDEALTQKLPFIHKANSIEDLVKKLSLTNLKPTVERYNELCKKGIDEDFGKDSHFLVSVERGPFYAFDLGVGAFTTLGGLKTDLDNHVLDRNGKIIDGLYAIGADAAGKLCGDTYSPNICGTCAGYCAYSGRKAALDIAKNLTR